VVVCAVRVSSDEVFSLRLFISSSPCLVALSCSPPASLVLRQRAKPRSRCLSSGSLEANRHRHPLSHHHHHHHHHRITFQLRIMLLVASSRSSSITSRIIQTAGGRFCGTTPAARGTPNQQRLSSLSSSSSKLVLGRDREARSAWTRRVVPRAEFDGSRRVGEPAGDDEDDSLVQVRNENRNRPPYPMTHPPNRSSAHTRALRSYPPTLQTTTTTTTTGDGRARRQVRQE